MKYQVEISIDLPRDKVIELLDDPDNLMKWQPGLQNFEPISGEPGQEGAKSSMHFKMGKREIDMTETILKRDFPEVFNLFYETKGVKNWVNNRFEAVEENKTLWVSDVTFEMTGFMKLWAWLMPGAFKKQSLKYLKLFKDFAEAEA